MSATLTQGQRLLLESLRADGVIWKSPAGYRLMSPWIAGATLTEETVQALLTDGYLTVRESYGRDRCTYTLSAAGELAIRQQASA